MLLPRSRRTWCPRSIRWPSRRASEFCRSRACWRIPAGITRRCAEARLRRRPLDVANRHFETIRLNALRVADFSYVAMWSELVYAAFVIDVLVRRTVGWRVTRSMRVDVLRDALDQALRWRATHESLIHRGDRGSQYLSIRLSERLDDASVKPSVGSSGGSYEGAVAVRRRRRVRNDRVGSTGPMTGACSSRMATCPTRVGNWSTIALIRTHPTRYDSGESCSESPGEIRTG